MGSVIRYDGKRGVVWRIAYRDGNGRQVMKTVGPEADGWTEEHAWAALAERDDSAGRSARARARARARRQAYNLTGPDYQRMLTAQHGRCAICRELPPEGKDLHVDHDHSCCPGTPTCGKCTRGLLCPRCNLALAHIENVEFVEAAFLYLHHGRRPQTPAGRSTT